MDTEANKQHIMEIKTDCVFLSHVLDVASFIAALVGAPQAPELRHRRQRAQNVTFVLCLPPLQPELEEREAGRGIQFANVSAHCNILYYSHALKKNNNNLLSCTRV